MFPMGIRPNHLQPLPILHPFSSCSVLSVLSLRIFGATLQKSSTRFFSFNHFQNKGPFGR
jgi:hypothetical protein